MMPWQTKPPGGELPDGWKKWGALVALVIATVSLLKMLWTPMRALGKRVAENSFLAVLKRCPDEVRRVLRESILNEEIAQMDRTEDRAHANADAIEGLATAQSAQGVALVELERAREQIERRQDKLDLIPETMERIEGAQRVVAGQLNKILGRFQQMDKQGEWDGLTDRRKGPRGSPPEGIPERREEEDNHVE